MGSFWELVKSGGWVMIPLLAFSLVAWGVILERLWFFRRLERGLQNFHWEAQTLLLKGDWEPFKAFLARYSDFPTAQALQVGFERLQSKDLRLRKGWREAIERRRLSANQEMREYLWVLGTIGSASPFVGLFGTVVGILQSFHQMALKGSGGFAVVASGISEALVATAAGILIAVIAVMAYNAFQTRLSGFVLRVRAQVEELSELLEGVSEGGEQGARSGDPRP